MGIGGQGISAVAQMVLKASGDSVEVTGCDMQASATTRALERIGVPVEIGHSADHLAGIDRLVVVPAVLVLNPDRAELATASARGIPMITWQEMLGELMQEKCVISVSGVHGKGTTTAMLALMLVDAGFDPTCEIGAVVPRFGGSPLSDSSTVRSGLESRAASRAAATAATWRRVASSPSFSAAILAPVCSIAARASIS